MCTIDRRSAARGHGESSNPLYPARWVFAGWATIVAGATMLEGSAHAAGEEFLFRPNVNARIFAGFNDPSFDFDEDLAESLHPNPNPAARDPVNYTSVHGSRRGELTVIEYDSVLGRQEFEIPRSAYFDPIPDLPGCVDLHAGCFAGTNGTIDLSTQMTGRPAYGAPFYTVLQPAKDGSLTLTGHERIGAEDIPVREIYRRQRIYDAQGGIEREITVVQDLADVQRRLMGPEAYGDHARDVLTNRTEIVRRTEGGFYRVPPRAAPTPELPPLRSRLGALAPDAMMAAGAVLDAYVFAEALASGPRNAGNLALLMLDPQGVAAAVRSGQLRVVDLIPFVGGNPAVELILHTINQSDADLQQHGLLPALGLVPFRVVDTLIVEPIMGLIIRPLANMISQPLADFFNFVCGVTGACRTNHCVVDTPGCERRGGGHGDVHIATYDGVLYDLQGVGEFVLATNDDDLTVQLRMAPWGASTLVSVNTAVAMQVGSNRVAYYLGETPPFRVDGVPTELSGSLLLSGGGRVDATPEAFYVTWPSGDERLHCAILGDHLDVNLSLVPDRVGALRGLLGDTDGDPQNDFATRSGEVLAQPLSFIDLYNVFATEWRVTEEESLFDYAPGQSSATFTDLEFPREPLAAVDLAPEVRAAAEAACGAAGVVDPDVLEGCILDVAVTQSPTFAEGSAGVPPPTAVLVSSCPEPRTVVGYGGSNFQYLVTSEEPPDGWEEPGLDTSAWLVSDGPIGNAPGCGEPLLNAWPPGHRALVRLEFDLVDACGLELGFSFTDEIVEVYLNGHRVLPRSIFNQRCAGSDDLVLRPARAAWRTGRNLLAVHLRSNFSDFASYDHRVTLGQFTGSGIPECAGSDGSCDGRDDDCDGAVDDDYQAATTSCGFGVCARTGALTCTRGQLVDDCAPGEQPPGDFTCFAPVPCPASDQCHLPGLIDHATGLCVSPQAPEGSPCSDGDACTLADTCRAGTCTGGQGVVCPAPEECRMPGSCDSTTGLCEYADAPDGTPCADADACTVGGTCLGGMCAPGGPRDCDDGRSCSSDTCDPLEGCVHDASACPPRLQGCDQAETSCLEVSVGRSTAGAVASATDSFVVNPVALINDGVASLGANGWGSNGETPSSIMIRLPRERDVFRLDVFLGGDDTGNWFAGTSYYLPAELTVQVTTDPMALVTDAADDPRWISVSEADRLSSSAGQVSGSRVLTELLDASWGTTLTLTFERQRASAVRLVFAAGSVGGDEFIGQIGELDVVAAVLGGDCTDSLQNQGEDAVDCGGPCAPCTCEDGLEFTGEAGCPEISVGLASRGGVASASDSFEPNPPSLLNDGVASAAANGWGNNGFSASRIMVLLSTTFDVFELNVFFGGDGTGSWLPGTAEYLPQRYVVQVSNDPNASASDPVNAARWTNLSEADGLSVNQGHVSGIHVFLDPTAATWGTTQTVQFNPRSVRAVRLVFDAPAAGGSTFIGQVGELDVVATIGPASCSDGLRDQGETSVDCGGPCAPCSCSDGVFNQGELGTDCGGPCPDCSCDEVFTTDASTLARFELNGSARDSGGGGRDATLLGGTFVETQFGRGLLLDGGLRQGLDWSAFAPLLTHPYTIELVFVPEPDSCFKKLFTFDDREFDGWYYCDAFRAFPNDDVGELTGGKTNYLAIVSTSADTVDVYAGGALIGSTGASFIAPPPQALFFQEDLFGGGFSNLAGTVEAIRVSSTARGPAELAGVQARLTDGCTTLAASCGDGVENQGEVGIDCGGPCGGAACSCSDGLQNQGEAGIDCGGPCAGCPTSPCGLQDLGNAIGASVASGTTQLAEDGSSGTCGGAGSGDVAFTFTASVAGNYTFDTLGSRFDTILAVREGCGEAELACADDTVGLRAAVTVGLAAGQSVTLVVDGYEGAEGSFVLGINQDPPRCGDGFVHGGLGEACDDGEVADFDGCSGECSVEPGWTCTAPATGASTCGAAACGDGIAAGIETCDDGNTLSNDGCSARCAFEFCGDGVTQGLRGEGCDDGNFQLQDGCDRSCAIEPGFACTGGEEAPSVCAPTCGDGTLAPGLGEECDDGNPASGDGCDARCLVEQCGNARTEGSESCDDGDTEGGDGCDGGCRREYCGDAVVQAALGEDCDDGNWLTGDGCNNTCNLEGSCGDGIVQDALGELCDGTPECTSTCKPACSDGLDLGSALGLDVAVGSTAGALNLLSGACGGAEGSEVTFTWTAPADGLYTFDTLGSALDTVLYLRLDGCSGDELACNDDAAGGARSRVAVELFAGQRVIIVVDGASAPGELTLGISASCPLAAATPTGLLGSFPMFLADYAGGGVFVADELAGATPLAEVPGLLGGLAIGGGGELYTCAEDGDTLTRIDSSGTATIASGLGGCAGVTVDFAGNVYVAETFRNQISTVSSTGAVSVFAVGLFGPARMAIDGDGNLLVTELGAGRVSRIGPGGTVEVIPGILDAPFDLAIGPDGMIYISQPFARQDVVRLDGCGGVSAVTDGIGVAAGVVQHNDGRLFVGDMERGRVIAVDPASGDLTPMDLELEGPIAMCLGTSS